MKNFRKLINSELEQLAGKENVYQEILVDTMSHPLNDDLFVVVAQQAKNNRVCRTCLQRKFNILFNSTSDIVPEIDFDTAESTVIDCASSGFGMAITNAEIAQSWSMLAPWPDCQKCTYELSELIPERPYFSYTGEKLKKLNAGNGIQRKISSENFNSAHRGYFGFASVLLNPSIDSTGGIYTVDTGMFLDKITDFAPVGGKGTSLEQALASCIGEGIERYYICSRPMGETQVFAARHFRNEKWYGALDFDKKSIAISDDSQIEVRSLEVLGGRDMIYAPDSLIFAPYTPPNNDIISPTPSSTTGAAAGGTIEEATLQAIFELIERDAFWFATRTNMSLIPIGQPFHSSIADSIRHQYDVDIVLRWVPNPLQIPIAHCTIFSNIPGVNMCSRGMGVTPNPQESINKSIIEAIQMWRSIATGVEVTSSETDMRSLWWSGKAKEIFPGLFGDSEYTEIDNVNFWEPSSAETPDSILQELVEHASRNGIYFARSILNDSGWHSVVRCISNRILPLDDVYFPKLRRFDDWSKFTSTKGFVKYTGPLFM
ncbi:YcaO-like family protein [Rothia nasisuis]|uniref:YcaO-like family protein n=1 Tax=Rothia nasisuis TaxID=2109647 RepID=UPI001F294282|nr:YcaO-like family protein [Rothia nasisuis]